MIQAVLGLWAVAIVGIAVLRPRWLLATAVVLSVFEGAALFKAGGLGVSPYYLTLILIALRCLAVPVTGDGLLAHTPAARRAIMATIAFALVAVVGAVVLPKVFAGAAVLSPRLSDTGTAPLEFSNSNIGQAVYLLLNVALMWSVAQQPRADAAVRAALSAVMAAGAIVVGLALYQLAAALTGLPFPDDLLYSNDGYVMQAGTAVMDMPRISSTFTEPAGMAVFLVGLVALLSSDAGPAMGRAAWRVPLLVAAVAVLMLSTSSTAYVGLAGIGAWRLWGAVVVPVMRGRPNGNRILLTVAGLAAVVVAVWLSPALRDLMTKMVFEKDQSASYDERSAANAHSWQLARDTFGLGTGLGSNRASGFVPSLLSTVGVWGVVLLAAAVAVLLRSPAAAAVRPAHRALGAALLGVIGAKILSGPDLSTPAMWALMATLVATQSVPTPQIEPAAVKATAETEAEAKTPAEPPRPPRRRFVESTLAIGQAGTGA